MSALLRHPTGHMMARGLIVLLVAVTLAGCGKKNAPTAPPGEPNTYPRQYPSE